MNKFQLKLVVSEINERLEAVQHYCGREKNLDAKIKFPRGFIRTASELRKKLPSDLPPLLTHNLSYALMTLDVLRWVVVRTDLSGAAESMIIKRSIAQLAEIIETLVKHYTKKKKFGKAIDCLVENQTIDRSLGNELHEIWDMRTTIHLWEATELEHDKFKRGDYNKAYRSYEKLVNCLKYLNKS